MSNKKVIVTGAAGFIGLNLLNSLIKKENLKLEIIAVDNLKTSSFSDFEKILKENKFSKEKNFFYKKQIKVFFLKSSYAKLNNIKFVNFNNIHCLIHLAAQTGVVQSMKFPEKDAEENLRNIMLVGLSKILHVRQNSSCLKPRGRSVESVAALHCDCDGMPRRRADERRHYHAWPLKL